MQNAKELFTIIKLEPFCTRYTDIKARGGLYHRINGKGTDGKPKDLTEDDKQKIKSGLEKFIADIQKVADSL